MDVKGMQYNTINKIINLNLIIKNFEETIWFLNPWR